MLNKNSKARLKPIIIGVSGQCNVDSMVYIELGPLRKPINYKRIMKYTGLSSYGKSVQSDPKTATHYTDCLLMAVRMSRSRSLGESIPN